MENPASIDISFRSLSSVFSPIVCLATFSINRMPWLGHVLLKVSEQHFLEVDSNVSFKTDLLKTFFPFCKKVAIGDGQQCCLHLSDDFVKLVD